MKGLLVKEQAIYDEAIVYLSKMAEGELVEKASYEALVGEYGKLLTKLHSVALKSAHVVRKLESGKKELHDRANTDALTGLYNRHFMEENFEDVLEAQSFAGATLSVMMVDVDHFKEYNDTYGHIAGDACLRQVATAIAECLWREDDFVVRYGGEEFFCVLPHTPKKGAQFIAKRMQEKVRDLAIVHEKNEEEGFVTISIGITSGDVSEDHCGEDYIHQADKALYESKKNGRNQVTYFGFEKIA